MKILQSTARYYPAIGGVEDFVKNLSEHLGAMGHDVAVAALDFQTPVGKNPDSGIPGSIGNVDVHRFRTRFPPGLNYPASLSMFSWLARWQGDIMHAHCIWYFPGDATMFLGMLKHKPFFYTPYYYLAQSRMRKIYLKLMKPLILRADRIISISRYEYDSLVTLGLPRSKLTIIPPGMNIEQAQNVQDNIYEKLDIRNKPIILAVNRLSVEKHVEVLIRAAPAILQTLPEAHFVIVGPDFGQQDFYTREIEKLGLQMFFTFPGILSKQNLFSAYQHADVFCHMADGELFGVTLMEALACGLPVIAVDNTAVPEIIRHEEHGILYPFGDSKTLAEQVLKLVQDNPYANQLVNQGKQFVERNFALDRVVEQYMTLYKTAL